MKRLDDENLRARYDRQGMIQVLDRFSVQCSEESLEIQAVMLEVICPVPIAFSEELLNSTNVRDLRVAH